MFRSFLKSSLPLNLRYQEAVQSFCKPQAYDAYLRLKKLSLLTALWILLAANTHATMLVHHNNQEHEKDTREHYEIALLRLVLEKTQADYGGFEMKSGPVGMTRARRLHSMTRNIITNHISTHPYDKDIARNPKIEVIPFPVFLGSVGYRVCFVSKKIHTEFTSVQALHDLQPFIHGLGSGWIDVDIFRSNDLKVQEVVRYESLFHMLRQSRIDTFCRGINEVRNEYLNFGEAELLLDDHLLLYYELPIFFITSRENRELIERVTEGLSIAHKDGSMYELWLSYFADSVKFSEIEGRYLVKMEQPFNAAIPFEYKKYFLTLDRLKEIDTDSSAP